MKHLIFILMTFMSLNLMGCSQTPEERMHAAELRHQKEMAMIQNGMNPAGMHTGMRTTQAYPQQYVNQGPSYLETMAIAAGAGYVMNRFMSPYEPTTRTIVVNGSEKRQYFDKKGKVITLEEYGRRQRQSADAKAAYRAKESKRLDAWKAKNKTKFVASEKKWSKENPKKAKARKDLIAKSKATTLKTKNDTALKTKNDIALKQKLQAKSKLASKNKANTNGSKAKLLSKSKMQAKKQKKFKKFKPMKSSYKKR